uniref:Uncharacterized protein n=1 Tax=Xenopus tropicalis TaxID=8364 RepID=A0A1B8XTB8_XENTR
MFFPHSLGPVRAPCWQCHGSYPTLPGALFWGTVVFPKDRYFHKVLALLVHTWQVVSLCTRTAATPGTRAQTQSYTLPRARTQTQSYTLPRAQTQSYTLPRAQTQSYTLPRAQTQSYTLPGTSAQWSVPTQTTQTRGSVTPSHIPTMQCAHSECLPPPQAPKECYTQYKHKALHIHTRSAALGNTHTQCYSTN